MEEAGSVRQAFAAAERRGPAVEAWWGLAEDDAERMKEAAYASIRAIRSSRRGPAG